jgi:hypothetical protein
MHAHDRGAQHTEHSKDIEHKTPSMTKKPTISKQKAALVAPSHLAVPSSARAKYSSRHKLQQRPVASARITLFTLWRRVGGEKSLGHMWPWAYRRSADERGQGIRAANDLAAAPLSRKNCEALCLEKAP